MQKDQMHSPAPSSDPECLPPNRHRQYTSRVQTARRLRADSTGPEKKLWSRLRNNQLGYRFRRQQPVGPYVVDFYCAAHGLVIELDGDSHLLTAEADEVRETYLRSRGLQVIRFSNDEVLKELDVVAGAILEFLPPLPLREGSGEGYDAAPRCAQDSVRNASQIGAAPCSVDDIQSSPRDPRFPPPQPSPSRGEGVSPLPLREDTGEGVSPLTFEENV